jgi:hypothetical protein
MDSCCIVLLFSARQTPVLAKTRIVGMPLCPVKNIKRSGALRDFLVTASWQLAPLF